MRLHSSLLRILATTLLVSPATAQAFNIDVGPNLILWPAPSSSYVAAAGQVGIWNAVRNPFAGDLLLDLTGATTSVTVSSNITNSFTYPLSGLTGDDEAFCSDGQSISEFSGAAQWIFSGLQDGEYQLYTYCWDPANSGTVTNVSLSGQAGSTQSVGGAWSGPPFVLGVTHSQHNVTVVGGLLSVEAISGPNGGSASVIGFQLLPGNSANSFCFGDGTGSSCPCGNSGAPGAGCQNSSGSGALLAAQGSASVAIDNLSMSVSSAASGTPALLFAGTGQVNGGQGLAFGDGLRCAGGQIQRLQVKILSQSGGASWGPNLATQNNWIAGDTRYLQVWFRDVNGGPCGANFNLSQALVVQFLP
jgi:hypothetical protein